MVTKVHWINISTFNSPSDIRNAINYLVPLLIKQNVQINTNIKGEIVGGVIIGNSAYMSTMRQWIVDKLKLENIIEVK